MGRAPCCTKVGLSRGQWTTEEDALLINYIHAHGEGYWKSLPKKAGLLRCGKSCRLRWKNYLQPDIKLGNISPDEEELIIRLHSLLGNRWSLIAGRLPGRTDNEIKNYWNTHLSRRLKSKVIDQKHPKGASKTRKNTKQDSDGETKTKIKVYRPKAVKVSPFPMTKLRGYRDRHVEVDQLVVSNGPWSSSDLNDAQNGVEANPGVSPFPTSVLPGYGDRNVRVDQLVVSNGPWSSSNINDAQNRVEAILGVSPFPPSVLPGHGDRNHSVVTNGPWSSSDPNDAQNGVEANLGVNDYDGYVPLQNSEQRHADKLEKIYEEFQQLVTAEDETALDSFVSLLLI